MPVIRQGRNGERTDVVCAFLHSDDVLFDPALQVFPPVFVVRLPPGPPTEWVRATVAYALAQAEIAPPGPEPVPTRLPELLLIQVLRSHLASGPAADQGWLAALRDPVLAPALAARFREVLGRSPIRYLTDWRLHLARELLANTDLAISSIARRIGYDADEAFSRAFKRRFGQSPALWRAEHPLR